jgi:hypothetical protein
VANNVMAVRRPGAWRVKLAMIWSGSPNSVTAASAAAAGVSPRAR